MSSAVHLSEQAQEVALAEAQAVRALASGEEYRGRLADLIAAVGDGLVQGEEAATLAELRALEGRELGSVELTAVGPGAFALSLATGGLEVSLRLDRQGARVSSVGI